MTQHMKEVIAQSNTPQTITSLKKQLASLGVTSGMTLIVHSSLRSLGYVIGGAPSVILALEAILGSEGTLAMPTHSADLTDPSTWSNPSVPPEWFETIRDHMPAFHPDLTPTRGMGAIPECFRKQQSVLRSTHPFVSWAARGPAAKSITAGHELAMSQGETSPLAQLYKCHAYVLLLGVGYRVNTSFHLAEYRCRFARQKHCKRGGPVAIDAHHPKWRDYDDIYWYDQDFEDIGIAFENTHQLSIGMIGNAQARLFSQREVVDFAVRWMNKNRSLQ